MKQRLRLIRLKVLWDSLGCKGRWMYVSDEKKSLERNALDAFLQSNRKLKGYTIVDGERPDFVLTKNGHKIGIEHFVIIFCF